LTFLVYFLKHYSQDAGQRKIFLYQYDFIDKLLTSTLYTEISMFHFEKYIGFRFSHVPY